MEVEQKRYSFSYIFDNHFPQIVILLMITFSIFLIWIETNPLRSKIDDVYFKGRKHHVVMIEHTKDNVFLTLENSVRVNVDSVESAKPRNLFSGITDLRTKYKF